MDEMLHPTPTDPVAGPALSRSVSAAEPPPHGLTLRRRVHNLGRRGAWRGRIERSATPTDRQVRARQEASPRVAAAGQAAAGPTAATVMATGDDPDGDDDGDDLDDRPTVDPSATVRVAPTPRSSARPGAAARSEQTKAVGDGTDARRARCRRLPNVELPERASEGRPSDPGPLPRRWCRARRIGDTRPAPAIAAAAVAAGGRRRRLPERAAGRKAKGGRADAVKADVRVRRRCRLPTGSRPAAEATGGRAGRRWRRPATDSPRNDRKTSANRTSQGAVAGVGRRRRRTIERNRGRERNGRPVGRYLMCVQVRDGLTQVAVLEGRSLVEHYVSRPADDVGQIHGNIYLGRVQNVLPGMEAAFVDISTPKNAVLYRGDVQYDSEDIVERGRQAAHRADAQGPPVASCAR